MTAPATIAKKLFWEDVREGADLPVLTRKVTATTIVAGALASRDFQPVHHDKERAVSQGNQDTFMNILTSGGWASKYVTNWSGPDADVKKLTLRLGTSCYPGHTFVWTGKVLKKTIEDGQHLVEVSFTGKVDIGDHCVGTATLVMPSRVGH